MPETVESFIPTIHYEKVCEWWKGHGWPIIPIPFLPSRGYIIPDVAAGFLYSTDSNIAWMEWIVGNPKANSRTVYEGIKTVVEHIKEIALEDGYGTIFTTVRPSGLEKVYNKVGFTTTDKNMNLMIWRK